MNEQPKGNASDSLEVILGALNSTPGVKGCLVTGMDGFILAHSIPSSLKVDDAAALSSHVYGISENCANGLKHGALDEVLIEGREGSTLLRKVDGVVLVAILGPDANFGLVRMEARKAAEKMEQVLGEPTPVDKVNFKVKAGVPKKPKERKVASKASKPPEAVLTREVLLKSRDDGLLEASGSVSPDEPPLNGPPAREVLKIGDRVRCVDFEDSGIVERLKREEALIQWDTGGLAWLSLSDLQAVLIQEKSVEEKITKDSGKADSRDSVLKKFRLKDPDEDLIDELVSAVDPKLKRDDDKDEVDDREGDEVGRDDSSKEVS